MPRTKSLDKEITLGGLTIYPPEKGAVWISDTEGRGGTFPAREVKKVLNSRQPAKAFRKYWDENFP